MSRQLLASPMRALDPDACPGSQHSHLWSFDLAMALGSYNGCGRGHGCGPAWRSEGGHSVSVRERPGMRGIR